MKTIAVVHQKGGVGKSTIAQALSVNLDGPNRIYDADAQATSATFVRSREANGVSHPSLATGRIETLTKLIAEAEKDGITHFIIDTPPEQASEINLRAALEVADFALLPTKAGANDVQVLPKTINIAKQLNVPFAVLLNEFDGRRTLHRQIMTDLENLAQSNGGRTLRPLRNLAVHQEASFHRECATEFAPSSDGSRDLILMTREIEKLTKG